MIVIYQNPPRTQKWQKANPSKDPSQGSHMFAIVTCLRTRVTVVWDSAPERDDMARVRNNKIIVGVSFYVGSCECIREFRGCMAHASMRKTDA